MTWEEYKAKGVPGRIEAILNGENPTLVTRLESGFVVLGDSQMLPGYCVLLAYPNEEYYAPEVMFDLVKRGDMKRQLSLRLQELVKEHG
jgi:hypothetical protein